MKHSFLNKPVALSMMFMLFLLLPTWLAGQQTWDATQAPKPKKCTTHADCCRLCLCIIGHCVYVGGGFLANAEALSDTDKTDLSSISYWLESDRDVSIRLYDASGQLIRTLVDEWMPGGEHQLSWNEKDDTGNTLNPGMYLLTLQAGDIRETAKVVALN